ncbi:hypothetical protein [Priestia megaterium]|uniref:Uncharacterized protein n=1 Tax=Priestia megaterium TaxID=1404 RepID=A0A6M6E6J8_PRIMG|nr:hypothetical protein [Priestia megaterium]QJX80759.1 hypothetical protein FDZ14_32225 [Priestia megaterium]
MMYFMNNEEELRGKIVAYTQMAGFADAITIVTADKGILVVEQEVEEVFEKKTTVYHDQRAEAYFFQNKYVMEELVKRNIITKEDIAKYKQENL